MFIMFKLDVVTHKLPNGLDHHLKILENAPVTEKT